MSDALRRFQNDLRDLFQFDFADLDFGIYRLFRVKRDEVEAFIEEDLPKLVDEAFGAATADALETTKERAEQLALELRDEYDDALLDSGDVNPEREQHAGKSVREKMGEYAVLRDRLAGAEASEAQKADVFRHLATFFGRYYEDGDFMPVRRYGRDETYAVPYAGEEVMTHWTTRGMHYIKSGERFKDYAFEVPSLGGDVRVAFALTSADIPKDNTKGDRRYFFPLVEHVAFDDGTLTVPFHYRLPTASEGKVKQDGLLEDALPELLAQIERVADFVRQPLESPADGDEQPLLLKRLRHFTRRQASDYFLCPDLADFLRRELEFYLKDEVLDLADLRGNFEAKARTIQVIRDVARKVIAFLDQIERVQVRLFEKPKWVLRTDYLVPIRHVPEELWEDVLQSDKQKAAWADLFGTPEGVDADFLRSHPTLTVNTTHFGPGFRFKLLGALPFEDLDDATDGVLINSENYQALRLMSFSLRASTPLIYIDPPYNTGSDGFIYKDRYQTASWLSLMEERLVYARDLMEDDGAIFVSIGDDEQTTLRVLLNRVFGRENFIAMPIWQKVYSPKNSAKYFSDDHEYVVVHAKSKDVWRPNLLPRTDEANARYQNPDEDERGDWKPADITARNYYSEGQYEVVSPSGKTFTPGVGRYWTIAKAKFLELDTDNRVWWGESGDAMPQEKLFLTEVKQGIVPQTLWTYQEVGHTQKAKKELLSTVRFERTEDVLNTVKPTELIKRILRIGTDADARELVIDFFAGSGTTGHATINLNREDGGQRTFMLVEMGEYFDSILMQRMQRILYAPEWSDLKPKEEPAFDPGADLPAWVERTPRLVKVLRVESYDDALHNLAAVAEAGTSSGDGAPSPEAVKALVGAEDYRLRYLFSLPATGAETLLGFDRIAHPFDLEMAVLSEDDDKTAPLDPIETTNLLLGLHVVRYEPSEEDGRRYLFVHARKGGERVLVVWRDLDELDPEQDRAVIQSRAGGYDRILVNGDAAHPKAVAVETELQPIFDGTASGAPAVATA